jgi:hypothetical protein
MTPNRRQFFVSIAGVPLLLQPAGAQQQSAPGAKLVDPVFDEIMANLRGLVTEFETQPAARKATLRAIESTLGIQAAHIAAHYDPDLRGALRRRLSRGGRPAFIQQILAEAHQKNQNFSSEAVDAAITRFERHGLAGTLRDVQQTVRKARQLVAEQFQAVAVNGGQYDYCADLRWMIELAELAAAIACAFLLTPGGQAACAAATAAVALLLAQKMWFGC